MKRTELDRALERDTIEPSSGFTAGVMAQVRLAATEPPPLRFPWGRFALGLASCSALAGAGAALTAEVTTGWTAQATAAWNATENALSPVAVALSPLAVVGPQLGYAALGLVLSLALSRLPRLFIRS
jgi:hypothetical protein